MVLCLGERDEMTGGYVSVKRKAAAKKKQSKIMKFLKGEGGGKGKGGGGEKRSMS